MAAIERGEAGSDDWDDADDDAEDDDDEEEVAL